MSDSVLFARATRGRLLGGVCAGLGDAWLIDRNLVRLAFALLALASGLGIAVYLLLWLTLPDDKSDAAPLSQLVKGNAKELGSTLSASARGLADAWSRTERSPWPRPLTRRWMGMGLFVAGGWLLLASLGLFDWLGISGALGLIAMAIGVALIKSLSAPAPGQRRR